MLLICDGDYDNPFAEIMLHLENCVYLKFYFYVLSDVTVLLCVVIL